MTISNLKNYRSKNSIYARKRQVKNLKDCYFYHKMNIPGIGIVGGEWDLRNKESQYLGGVNFKKKRVLEIGTADGFLCFFMEKKGAEVVAYDLSDNQEWDMVPFAQYDYKKQIQVVQKKIRKLNNAFWYAHKAYRSKAKMVYGSVYKIPKQIGLVDISTFGSVLLHLRDPFLAIQKASELTKETIIVTDLMPDHLNFYQGSLLRYYIMSLKKRLGFSIKVSDNSIVPYMTFEPNCKSLSSKDAWWRFSPGIIIRFLGVLGFEKNRVQYDYSSFKYQDGIPRPFFTVVANRTAKIKR
jgi:hypothetical protein